MWSFIKFENNGNHAHSPICFLLWWKIGFHYLKSTHLSWFGYHFLSRTLVLPFSCFSVLNCPLFLFYWIIHANIHNPPAFPDPTPPHATILFSILTVSTSSSHNLSSTHSNHISAPSPSQRLLFSELSRTLQCQSSGHVLILILFGVTHLTQLPTPFFLKGCLK